MALMQSEAPALLVSVGLPGHSIRGVLMDLLVIQSKCFLPMSNAILFLMVLMVNH